jgi:large subunit ribosomal protein L5
MHPFLTTYTTVSIPKLKAEREYISDYMIPRVTKVVLNMGIGDLQGNNKGIEDATILLTQISGQKPVLTKARKAISGFKIRIGMQIGLKVTLRGERMYDFISKLSGVTLPRTRDFRGLKPSAITADGNLNLGIRDTIIFPEASQDGIGHGVQVTIVSTARTKEEAHTLYTSLGFPFQSEQETA